jgi:hypothetical protein
LASKTRIIWLFGRSGAGKTTLASLLVDQYRAMGTPCLWLDGDRIRQGLSQEPNEVNTPAKNAAQNLASMAPEKHFNDQLSEPNKRERQKFDEISHLRFGAILLIVCNHLGFGIFSPNAAENLGFKIWFEFTSPILAIISGYLFFFNFKGDNFLPKLKSRIFSLVVPYVVWTIFYISVLGLFKHTYLWLGNPPIWNTPIPTLTWDYLVNVFIFQPIVPNFWYLQNLILIIPLNWLVLKTIEKPFLFEFLYGILLVLIYYNVPVLFSDRFVQYYLAGCYLGSKRVILGFPFINNQIVLIGVFFSLLFVEFRSRSFPHSTVVNIPVIFLLVVSILELIKRHQGSYLHNLFARYESHSFFIFAAHTVVLSMIRKAVLLSFGQPLSDSIVSYLFLIGAQFIAAVIGCILLSKLILSINCRLWLIMTGLRK